MAVVLFADSIFTLTDEVQRIWGRRFTGATLIFLLTRWVAVAERIVLVTSVVLPTIQDKVRLPQGLSANRIKTDVLVLFRGMSAHRLSHIQPV